MYMYMCVCVCVGYTKYIHPEQLIIFQKYIGNQFLYILSPLRQKAQKT